MLNKVAVVGILKDIDEKNSNIRYLEVRRSYKDDKGQYFNDLFPCMMWTRNDKNQLFSYQNGTLVAIDGRLETENNMIIIIIESITYLLGKEKDFNTRGS